MTPLATTDIEQALAPAPAAPIGLPRSIVVATDGTNESDGAIEAAENLATRSSAVVRVVSVVEPAPPPPEWPPFVAFPPFDDPQHMLANQRARVRTQLTRVLDLDKTWPITMSAGAIGSEIATFARDAGADLIVAGRGKHGVVDRLLGEEHLTRLLRTTDVPVLAVDRSLSVPVSRVVIATDFSAYSLYVARIAATLISDDATVYLVHVKPDPPFGVPHPGQWLRSYEGGVRAGLERLRTQLSLPKTCTTEEVILNGHPGVMLAEFALATRSELIVVGVQGAGFWNHLVVGSVTSYLLREAPCSLLAVPVREQAKEEAN